MALVFLSTFIHWFLHPLAWMRRALYRYNLCKKDSLPGLVISVGNLASGGTGKTPVTIALARALQAHGHHPAILTRGYRSGLKHDESLFFLGSNVTTLQMRRGTSAQNIHADEAQMQAEALQGVPVIVGKNRVQSARSYLKSCDPPSVWILDDGFQHLRLKRDLNIVLLDAQHPWGGHESLALSIHREARFSLRDCDLVLFTRFDASHPPHEAMNWLKQRSIPYCGVPFTMGLPRCVHEGKNFQPFDPSKSYSLVAAIAVPQRLVGFCTSQKILIHNLRFFSDHTHINLPQLLDLGIGDGGVITTAKDYARNKEVFDALPTPTFILPLEVALPWDHIADLMAKVLVKPTF